MSNSESTQLKRALSPGSRIGRYEILARLASGGMATVYAARALGTFGFERLVAVKVLHENLAQESQFISMFLDEARLAARIRHPNVVSTVDVSDVCGSRYFLVMEYIEGDHLGQLLRGARRYGQRLSVPVVLRIMTDVLSGLAAAHNLRDEKGKWLELVHRDVSPHNIMVGRDGVARLTDFGVAKAEGRLTQTREGQVKGKLAYMAPEQASSGCSDERSDLFSAGVLLWESLTGRRLFRAPNSAAILNKILRDPIAMPSQWDPQLRPLDKVVKQALCRDPAQRFTSAEEFCATLEVLADEVYGGVASRRTVGNTVAALAREKLERDRRVIASVLSGRILTAESDAQQVQHSVGHAGAGMIGRMVGGTVPSSTMSDPSDPSEPVECTLPGRLSARRRHGARGSAPSVSGTKSVGRWPGSGAAGELLSGSRDSSPDSSLGDFGAGLSIHAPERRPAGLLHSRRFVSSWSLLLRGFVLLSGLAAFTAMVVSAVGTRREVQAVPAQGLAPPSAVSAATGVANHYLEHGGQEVSERPPIRIAEPRAVTGRSARIAESDDVRPRSSTVQARRPVRPRATGSAGVQPRDAVPPSEDVVLQNPYLP